MKTIFGRAAGTTRRSAGGSRITRADFFSPLGVIAALTLLVLTLGIHFAVRAFDNASELREQTLAGNGITLRIEEVGQMIVPQTQWDDAVRYLDNSFDDSWADANIGKYFHETSGFDRSFVLDAANRPVFASINGERTEITAFEPIAPLAAPLVAKVRQMEAKRGPIASGASRNMISTPIQTSALKLVQGKMTIMTATLVQPDFGTATLSGGPAPVVVTTMAVGPEFLKPFSERFLFNTVHVRALDEAPLAGETRIPARDDTGRTIAWFAWQPLNPGYAMLRQLLPPIGLVCLVLGIVAYTQLRRIGRLADDLIRSEAEARTLAYYDPTTGLPNRLWFREQLALEISGLGDYHPSLVVHNVSFDGLSEIAETFGVDEREAFIAVAANRLAATCRDDAVIARTSDVGFAILSLDAGTPEGRALSQRLNQTMNKPISLDAGTIEVPCTVTAQTVTDPAADAHAILYQIESAPEDGAMPSFTAVR